MEEKIIIDRVRIDELELFEQIIKDNFQYLECEFSQYSMFKYWVPKKGVIESDVIVGLRAETKQKEDELKKLRREIGIITTAFNEVKRNWWYKLFS